MSARQVDAAAHLLRELLPPRLADVYEDLGLDLHDQIRFQAVAAKCRTAREGRGLTIKTAAATLRVAQRELRAIEEGQILEVQPDILQRYMALLGEAAWLARWAAHYGDSGRRFAGETAPDQGARRGARRRPGSRVPPFTRILVLDVTLLDVEPRVWRRLEVPDTYTFYELHVAIQDAMNWEDYHLHEFRVVTARSGRPLRIGFPNDDMPDDDETQLGWSVDLRDHLAKKGARVSYLYDFGDNWEHEVRYVGHKPRQPTLSYPRCVAGARACPPEDVGGPPGFFEFLSAIRDPAHEEHETMTTWSGGSYDPDAFEPAAIHFDDPRARWKLAMG